MDYKKFFKKIAFVFIYGIISSALAFLISSYLVRNNSVVKVYDSMTMIGLLIMVIGALSSVGGNPTGVGAIGLGQMNNQYISNFNIEVTKMERSITKYFESTANHTKLYFTSSKLNIILNGAFIILSSIVLSYFY